MDEAKQTKTVKDRVRNMEGLSCVPAQLYMGTSESYYCAALHTPSYASCTRERSSWNGSTHESTTVQNELLHCTTSCKFQIHLACFVRASALMHPWRCDSSAASRLDPPDRFIVSSAPDSTVTQRSSHRVHSQHPQEINGSVCLRCLRAAVGGVRFVVHCDQCDPPLLDRSVTPKCFEFQMLHVARSTSRHHTSCSVRVCVYSGRHQATDLCKQIAVGCHTLLARDASVHLRSTTRLLS